MRFMVFKSNASVLPWRVYDTVLQITVFHWYGDTGKAKCYAVAAALNALGHAKD